MTPSPTRFETLIERHHDEIYRYLWRLLNNAGRSDSLTEAQDLTQEVFLRAYRAFGRLRSDSNHRAWLYKIATHCAYTALKQDRRRQHYTSPLEGIGQTPASPSQSPEQQVLLKEALETIQGAIAGLPPKQRAAVILRHVQELDYPAIAQALDCSEDSARANVYRGLRRLRLTLTDQEQAIRSA